MVRRFVRWFIFGPKAWLTFAHSSRPRRAIRKALIWGMNKVLAKPRLMALALTWLGKFPKLKQRLKNIAISQGAINIHTQGSTLSNPGMCETSAIQLPPHARRIYMDIKATIEKRNQEGV